MISAEFQWELMLSDFSIIITNFGLDLSMTIILADFRLLSIKYKSKISKVYSAGLCYKLFCVHFLFEIKNLMARVKKKNQMQNGVKSQWRLC